MQPTITSDKKGKSVTMALAAHEKDYSWYKIPDIRPRKTSVSLNRTIPIGTHASFPYATNVDPGDDNGVKSLQSVNDSMCCISDSLDALHPEFIVHFSNSLISISKAPRARMKCMLKTIPHTSYSNPILAIPSIRIMVDVIFPATFILDATCFADKSGFTEGDILEVLISSIKSIDGYLMERHPCGGPVKLTPETDVRELHARTPVHNVGIAGLMFNRHIGCFTIMWTF